MSIIALSRILDLLSLSTSVVVRFIQWIRDVIPVWLSILCMCNHCTVQHILPGVRLIYPNQKHDSKSWFQNHKHDPATLQTLCFNSIILWFRECTWIRFETWTEYDFLVSGSYFWFAQIKQYKTPSPPSWMTDSLKIINWVWSTWFEILFPIRSNKTVNQNHDFESWFRFR